jgi:acyl carrier protein
MTRETILNILIDRMGASSNLGDNENLSIILGLDKYDKWSMSTYLSEGFSLQIVKEETENLNTLQDFVDLVDSKL